MQQRPRTRWLGRLLVSAGIALFVLMPAIAGADDYPPQTTPTTSGCKAATYPNVVVCDTTPHIPPPHQSLPFTGGDVALLTVVGLVATAAGVGLVITGRRSTAST